MTVNVAASDTGHVDVVIDTKESHHNAEYDPLNPQNVLECCVKLVPGWSMFPTTSMTITQLTVAMTNKLFAVTLSPPDSTVPSGVATKVLYRVFGDNAALYDMSQEALVFSHLGERGIAPRCIAMFPGGRIEEWLNGEPLPCARLREDAIHAAVAEKLACLHKLDISIENTQLDKEKPLLIPRMRQWIETSRHQIHLVHDEKVLSKLKQISLDSLIAEIDWFTSELKRQEQVAIENDKEGEGSATWAKRIAFHRAFCHNDCQENNIMAIDGKCTLRLVDFEYADYNYVGYDIGDFFIEATMDYCVPASPFYTLKPEHYPSKSNRVAFAQAYFSSFCGVDMKEEDLDGFLDAVDFFAISTHLFWALWCIIRMTSDCLMRDETLPIVEGGEDEFDLAHYGASRMSAYYALKKDLVERGVITMTSSST